MDSDAQKMAEMATAHAGASASQVTVLSHVDASAGACRVVDDLNVSYMSGSGWRPVAMWREYAAPNSPSPYDTNVSTRLGMWRKMFLMVQPADETLATAKQETLNAQNSLSEEYRKRTEAERELEQLKDKLKREQEAAEQPAPGEAALAEPQTAPKEEEQAQAAGDAAVEGAAASAEAGAAAGPPSDAALVARLKELLAEVDLATTTGGCWARGLGSAAPPRRALAACLSALACMASRGGGHAPCPAHPPLPHAARPRDRHRCREAAAQAAGGRVWVRAGRPQGAAARRDQRVPGGAGGWGGS